MKQIITAVLLLICAVSCTRCAKGVGGVKTDSYNHILQQFNSDLLSLGYSAVDFSQTEIREVDSFQAFDLTNKQALMLCGSGISLKKSGSIVIYVNKSVVTGFTPESSKVAIMYHELGHCVLGLKHTSVGTDLMYPQPSSTIGHDPVLRRQKLLEALKRSGHK